MQFEDVQISQLMETTLSKREPRTCMDACEMRGFPFSGIRNNSQCWCSQQLNYRDLATTQCKFCRGNHQYRCGGEGQTAVYFRPDRVPKMEFVKCISYSTDAEQQILNAAQGEFSYVSYRSTKYRQVTSCAQLCSRKGFRYAGVTHQFWCRCGNEIGDQRATFCDRCQGDRSQQCGQNTALSIYEIEDVYPNATVCGGTRQTVRSNSNIALQCRSTTGTEYLKFTWERIDRFDRVLIDSPKMSVSKSGDMLLFQDIGIEETGRYRCTVENLLIANRTFGVSSTSVDLIVEKPPIVTLKQPEAAINGQPVTFECDVQAFNSKQPLSVQWFYGDVPLAPFSATLLSMHTMPAQPVEDAGKPVNVPGNPDEPVSAAPLTGQSAGTLLTVQGKKTAAAAQRPRFTLQELATNIRTSGAGTSFKLTINRVDHRYWGNYTCRIYNPEASTRDARLVEATERMWLNGEARKVESRKATADNTDSGEEEAENTDPCGIRKAVKNGNQMIVAAVVFLFMITALLLAALYFLYRQYAKISTYDVRSMIHRNNAFSDGDVSSSSTMRSTLPAPVPPSQPWSMPESPGQRKSYRMSYNTADSMHCHPIREEVIDVDDQVDMTYTYQC
eukprot:scpid62735/ scgid25652/ 